MSTTQLANERSADARIAATPVSTPCNWASLRCPECLTDLSGLHNSTQLEAMRHAKKLMGFMFAADKDGTVLAFDSVNCWRKHLKNCERGVMEPPTLISVDDEPVHAKRAETPPRRRTTHCPRCAEVSVIFQTEQLDGSYSPNVDKFLETAGWTRSPSGRWFCSRRCLSLPLAGENMAHNPIVTPVLRASHQNALEAFAKRDAANPLLRNREIGPPVPPKVRK